MLDNNAPTTGLECKQRTLDTDLDLEKINESI
jgi:hypothetical protein